MKTIRLRRGFTEITRIYDLISGYGFIAGGYARYCASPKHDPYPAGDLDIFPLRKEGCFEPVRDKFLALGFTLYKENDVSYSFKKAPEGWEEVPSIQLIKPADEARMLTYGSPEEILNNFDFSVTRAAILSATEPADYQEHPLSGVESLALLQVFQERLLPSPIRGHEAVRGLAEPRR
jgi:hypothetical protein